MRKTLTDDVLLSYRVPITERDDRLDGFTPQLIGHADNGDLLDRRMPLDGFFDLARIDVGSAADDHVLLAVEDEHVAAAVHVADVTRVEPSVPADVRGRLRLAPVAAHAGAATNHDLAHLTARDLAVLRIDDPDLDAGTGDARRHEPLLLLLGPVNDVVLAA